MTTNSTNAVQGIEPCKIPSITAFIRGNFNEETKWLTEMVIRPQYHPELT